MNDLRGIRDITRKRARERERERERERDQWQSGRSAVEVEEVERRFEAGDAEALSDGRVGRHEPPLQVGVDDASLVVLRV